MTSPWKPSIRQSSLFPVSSLMAIHLNTFFSHVLNTRKTQKLKTGLSFINTRLIRCEKIANTNGSWFSFCCSWNFVWILMRCLHVVDGFHGDVIRLQSQKSEVLRILIYTRLKINRKYIFVQVSSPEACFTSKIQQFELPSFHSAWHQNRNAISLKKVSPLDFQQFNHFKY